MAMDFLLHFRYTTVSLKRSLVVLKFGPSRQVPTVHLKCAEEAQ